MTAGLSAIPISPASSNTVVPPPFPVNALPPVAAVMVPTANAEVHAEVDDWTDDLSGASLPVVAKMLDRWHGEAEASLRAAQGAADRYMVTIWNCGCVLKTVVKPQLKHGEYLPWVAQNTGISTRTAERYVEVFEKAPRVADLVAYGSVRKFLEAQAGPKKAKKKRKRKPIRPPSSAPYVAKWGVHIWQLNEHLLALDLLTKQKDFGEHHGAVVKAHAENIGWAKDIGIRLDAALVGSVSTPETKAAELVGKIKASVEELAAHIKDNPGAGLTMMLPTTATPLQKSLDGWLRSNFPALRHPVPADVVAAFHEAT